MKLEIFLIFIFSVLTTFSIAFALSQPAISCQDNTVCVNSGDSLNYTVSIGEANSSRVYYFENMLDANHIRVLEKFVIDNNSTMNNTLILDLKSGMTQSGQQKNLQGPFLLMLPIPIQYNKTNPSIIHERVNFNGFTRSALVAFQSSENKTSKTVYDMQTGILLSEYSLLISTIIDKPEILEFSNKLIQTNMINSDSSEPQVVSIISIPSWVKNNAKMWSKDMINDTEFINAIQYLVSNGIIQLPHDTSITNPSQDIPYWIKSNAGWWSSGKISNSDFVSGIQYLIHVGIIRVGI